MNREIAPFERAGVPAPAVTTTAPPSRLDVRMDKWYTSPALANDAFGLFQKRFSHPEPVCKDKHYVNRVQEIAQA
jgi:hypothetical protein